MCGDHQGMEASLDRWSHADVLGAVETVLGVDAPVADQLEAVAGLLGVALAATRVAFYGDSEAGDGAVRVRAAWSARGHAALPEWTSDLPLLTWRPVERAIASPAPRGEHCPSDCLTSAAGCPLREYCSTLIEPLRIGSRRYGRLGVHARTGRAWAEDERLLARMVAIRAALHVAARRMAHTQTELSAQRRGIATTVLHQLATPLTVIEGAVDHAARHGAAADDPLMDAAGVAVLQLHRLCEDLVAIAAPPERVDEPRDVRPELQEAVVAAERRHPRASFAATLPDELPLVACVPGMLPRVLGTLFDNAVRYGAEDVHVELDAIDDGDVLVLRVRDDGSGVPPDAPERLVGAFSRRDPDMRELPGGTGLGLAIVDRLARGAGGRMSIGPRTDRAGTQVTVCLPVAS